MEVSPLGELEASVQVDSVSDFCGRVAELARDWGEGRGSPAVLWFRGHADASWQPEPVLYRQPAYSRPSWAYYEANFFEQFRLQAPAFLERPPSDEAELEWYFLMRHHGLPTRLLDWSASATAALYFAVCEGQSDRGEESSRARITDAAVWVLDPLWLNRHALSTGPNQRARLLTAAEAEQASYGPYRYDWSLDSFVHRHGGDESAMPLEPIAVTPPHISPRIVAQKSRFTLHGRGLDRIKDLWAEDPGARIAKIVLPGDAVPIMRRQLVTVTGLTRASLFPDLDGVAAGIAELWGPQGHCVVSAGARRPQ